LTASRRIVSPFIHKEAIAVPKQPAELENQPPPEDGTIKEGRRPVLRKLGRFAAITAPAIALLLSARAKPARAVTSGLL
jgi:hypothetical protein